MSRNWEQEKIKVWVKAQRDFGFCVHPEIKKTIDNIAGSVADEEELECYRNSVYEHVDLAKKAVTLAYLPHPRIRKNPPNKRYQFALKKQLYLVEFVISRQLDLRKQRNKIRKEINWKDTCLAWNEAHPNDPRTHKNLKRAFYRAAADKDLQREYLEQMGIGIGEGIEGGFSGIFAWNRLINLMSSLVGAGSSLAIDWAIVLGLNDIPLDKHFPTPEIERMIRNNPYYARQIMTTILMQERFKHNLKAAQEAYEPLCIEVEQEAQNEGQHKAKN